MPKAGQSSQAHTKLDHATDRPVASRAENRPSGSIEPLRRSWLRDLVNAIMSLGPFAATITVYSLLLDNLRDSWFTYIELKYIFAGLGALCIGLALRLLAQRFIPQAGTAAAAAGAETAAAGETSLPAQHGEISRSGSPYSILASTANALQEDFRTGDHSGTTTYGWSQYLGEDQPPSAIGTSYGLRIAMALDLRTHQISYSRIVNSLLELQRAGGGWAASTQRGIARPEVTAWVLGAAVRAGLDHDMCLKLVRLLEHMTTLDDKIAFNHTTVVATIVSALADIAPRSERLPELSSLLAAGARPIENDDTGTSWGELLQTGPKVSVAHTARAVIALKKAARVLPGGTHLNAIANAGINWLGQGDDSFTSTDEQLRRPLSGGDVDALFIGHFTPSWVARALMASDNVPAHLVPLRQSVRAVVGAQRHGVWRWHDDSTPIWMTYQGASVVRDYILRGLEWPP